jgi:hypothetical protein
MQDEAFELIRALIDNIVLVPEGEELGIEIPGELAGILDAVPAKQNARAAPPPQSSQLLAIRYRLRQQSRRVSAPIGRHTPAVGRVTADILEQRVDAAP